MRYNLGKIIEGIDKGKWWIEYYYQGDFTSSENPECMQKVFEAEDEARMYLHSLRHKNNKHHDNLIGG